MIIFFNKKTREIIGHIAGRVHDQLVIEGANISQSGVPDEDIKKYVVPTKPKKVGKKLVELLPDVPFADKILLFEENANNIYKHKVKLDSKGKLIGFMENKT